MRYLDTYMPEIILTLILLYASKICNTTSISHYKDTLFIWYKSISALAYTIMDS